VEGKDRKVWPAKRKGRLREKLGRRGSPLEMSGFGEKREELPGKYCKIGSTGKMANFHSPSGNGWEKKLTGAPMLQHNSATPGRKKKQAPMIMTLIMKEEKMGSPFQKGHVEKKVRMSGSSIEREKGGGPKITSLSQQNEEGGPRDLKEQKQIIPTKTLRKEEHNISIR